MEREFGGLCELLDLVISLGDVRGREWRGKGVGD